MPLERAAEYRRKAMECVNHAHLSADPNDRANWLQMAEGWERMAQKVARREIIWAGADDIVDQANDLSHGDAFAAALNSS